MCSILIASKNGNSRPLSAAANPRPRAATSLGKARAGATPTTSRTGTMTEIATGGVVAINAAGVVAINAAGACWVVTILSTTKATLTKIGPSRSTTKKSMGTMLTVSFLKLIATTKKPSRKNGTLSTPIASSASADTARTAGTVASAWATTPDTASSSEATCSTRPSSRSPQLLSPSMELPPLLPLGSPSTTRAATMAVNKSNPSYAQQQQQLLSAVKEHATIEREGEESERDM